MLSTKIGKFRKVFTFIGIYIIGVFIFTVVVTTIYGEQKSKSDSDLNDITYQNILSVLSDKELSYFEKDFLIQKALREGDSEMHNRLILNDFTNTTHFVLWKKNYDSTTLINLIDQKKIYSSDATWIINQFDDPKVLVGIYDFLKNNDIESLVQNKEIFMKKTLNNISLLDYVFNNLPENSEFVEYFYKEFFQYMENDEDWQKHKGGFLDQLQVS